MLPTLVGIGGLLLGELIREGAAAAAEDNSGCYMLVTKGFDSALPISGVTCDKCLSFGESWVPGMTQLQSCKYGDKNRASFCTFGAQIKRMPTNMLALTLAIAVIRYRQIKM